MKSMQLVLTGVLLIGTFLACNKDKALGGVDGELYAMATAESGFTWYKFSDEYLTKSSGSGHNYPFLRTRFNSIAADFLDSQGRVQEGTIFPDGSLIVKELIEANNKIGRYAILYKDVDNEFADANGWVWGYINKDKSVAASASEKGASCISCHQQAENIDNILMNKFFE